MKNLARITDQKTDVLDPQHRVPSQMSSDDQLKVLADTHITLNNDRWLVVSPKKRIAAELWAKGTRWCLSHQHHLMANTNQHGDGMFVLMNKLDDDKNFLINDRGELLDKNNEPVKNPKLVDELRSDLAGLDRHIDAAIILADPERSSKFEFSEQASQLAASMAGMILKHLRKQTPAICLAAVKQRGFAIQFVEKQTPEICLQAVRTHGYALRFVKEITNELCMEAVKSEGIALEFVVDQTEELCKAAVSQDGLALQFVREQTHEICLQAVRQNGMSLEYVENPTKEIVIEAAKQSRYVLYRFNIKDPDVCLAAVKSDGQALQYVREQTPEICLAAVNQRGRALKFVKQQTPEICLAAVKEDPYAIKYVKKVSKELERYAKTEGSGEKKTTKTPKSSGIGPV